MEYQKLPYGEISDFYVIGREMSQLKDVLRSLLGIPAKTIISTDEIREKNINRLFYCTFQLKSKIIEAYDACYLLTGDHASTFESVNNYFNPPPKIAEP